MAQVLRSPQAPDDSSASAAARKKFATPPVKIACLACRASRTRCTGEHPCASCLSRERPCVYKPSRRGGPRVRKKPRPAQENQVLPVPVMDPAVAVPPKLPVENYVGPGAGLRNLTDVIDDSDVLFDSLFNNTINVELDSSPPLSDVGPMARSYPNDAAILNAYYIWIHPYFPVMPPPRYPLVPDDAVPLFEAKPVDIDESPSPVALAIGAILALIPCAQDPNPMSEESVLFRRKYSQFLAQSAFESTETETDKPESSVEPSRALEDSDDEYLRHPFHQEVPVELESTIALTLLCIYEYAQRGNLKRMKIRGNAALMSAMNLSLHTHHDDDDVYAEAKRRVWWMTWMCATQSCIVSSTKPAFDVFNPSFTAKWPSLRSDSEAWAEFVTAQQAILTATIFVIDLNATMQSHGDMTPMYQRMMELELYLEPLIAASETWGLNCPPNQMMDENEAVVSQALRCLARIKLNSSRIKLHRYCAFYDTPIFRRKTCDLKPFSQKPHDEVQELQHWPLCCSTINGVHSHSGSGSHSGVHSGPGTHSGSGSHSGVHSGPGTHSGSASSPTGSMRSTPISDGGQNYQTPIFPFSSHQSAKICLKSAFNISQGFELLPTPNPMATQLSDGPSYIGPYSSVLSPRTMPSFACCAMQCAYVLLMVHQKTQSMYLGMNADSGPLAKNLLDRLQSALLSILATVENYGLTFEALGGMRDLIRDRLYTSISFDSSLIPC